MTYPAHLAARYSKDYANAPRYTAPGRQMLTQMRHARLEMTCGIMRQGDENVCPKCGLRWPSDEERPACLK